MIIKHHHEAIFIKDEININEGEFIIIQYIIVTKILVLDKYQEQFHGDKIKSSYVSNNISGLIFSYLY